LSFFLKKKKVKELLSRDGYQWKEGGHKERVKEGEYDTGILYSSMKTEQRNL
jgi:hypothetical protein